MVKVEGNAITLTRGDTLVRSVVIHDTNGNVYTPKEGDQVRFALKSDFKDTKPLLLKEIPIDTMVLRLESSETKRFDQPKRYVYDIQITIDDGTEEGFVSTFISSTLTTVEEVD